MSVINSVPPPPYSTPFLVNGLLSPLWANWIKQIYLQIGNNSVAGSITTLNAAVVTLNTAVAALQKQTDNQTLQEFGRHL
jgi:hypothetical protein